MPKSISSPIEDSKVQTVINPENISEESKRNAQARMEKEKRIILINSNKNPAIQKF